MANQIQAAGGTKGRFLAHFLPVPDKEGMVFVEQPFIVGEIVHEESLQGGIVVFACIKPQPFRNTMSIGINDEYWLPGGIEDYRIGSLLTNTID